MRQVALACLAVVIVAATVRGTQLGPADDKRVETKHLTITLSASAATAAAGGKLSLYADVAPKPKMHVYAPDQSDYIPIALTVEAAPSFRLQPIQYPAGETFFFAPLNETQRVYSKPFRIVQPIIVATTGRDAPASLVVKGTIRYQACDDAICYLPQTIPVTWTVSVKGR